MLTLTQDNTSIMEIYPVHNYITQWLVSMETLNIPVSSPFTLSPCIASQSRLL